MSESLEQRALRIWLSCNGETNYSNKTKIIEFARRLLAEQAQGEMKLPIEVSAQIYKEHGASLGYEAIVRDCAKVCSDDVRLCHEDESYDNVTARRVGEGTAFNLGVGACVSAILARYGLELEKDHD